MKIKRKCIRYMFTFLHGLLQKHKHILKTICVKTGTSLLCCCRILECDKYETQNRRVLVKHYVMTITLTIVVVYMIPMHT